MTTLFNPLPQIHSIKDSQDNQKPAPVRRKQSPRDKEKYETKPVFIKKLFDLIRNKAEVSRIIGCSRQLINDALKNDSVTKAYELSAHRFYMLEMEKQANKNVTFAAKLPQEAWDALEPWLQQANAEYKVFTS